MKRLLSLLLLAAMLLTTACSTGGTPNETKDTTSSDTAPQTTAETTAPPEYVAPGVQYDGEAITIASYAFSFGYQIDKYTVALEEENADIINDAIVARNRTVEEELGVDLVQFPLDKNDRFATEKIKSQVMTDDDTIDFALQMAGGIDTIMTTENMLLDLRSIPTLDLTNDWWDQKANDTYMLYGKQQVAVGDICFYHMAAPIVTYFSKKLLADHELEDPYKLVKDGKWTLDKMTEMAATASVDLNGNGKVDDTDQFGFGGEVFTVEVLLYSGGIRVCNKDASGNIILTLNQNRTVDILEKAVTFLNTQNVVRRENMTAQTYTSVFTDYLRPKMMADELLFFTNQLLLALDFRAMESDFGILPTPKFDEAQESYHSVISPAWSDNLIVPVTTTDADMAGHVIEAMGYYSRELVTPAFVDTSVLLKSIRDDDSADMIEIIHNSSVYDIGTIFNWGNVTSIFSKLLSGNNAANFASSYAEIETAVKTAMEDTLRLMGKK